MRNDYRRDLAHGGRAARGVSSRAMNPFSYLIPIGLGVVFLTLCFGIYTLFRGGDFSRSWSNKAMRFRVIAQFVVILILVGAMLWSRSQHG
jgi:hypothetical protein